MYSLPAFPPRLTALLLSSFCFGLLPFVQLLAALHFAFAHLFTRSAPHHQSASASTTSPKRSSQPSYHLLQPPHTHPNRRYHITSFPLDAFVTI